jgi:hypothetical protein
MSQCLADSLLDGSDEREPASNVSHCREKQIFESWVCNVELWKDIQSDSPEKHSWQIGRAHV